MSCDAHSWLSPAVEVSFFSDLFWRLLSLGVLHFHSRDLELT